MKQFTRVSSPSAGPSALMRLFDWLSHLVDQALNFIFSLTHRVSVIRANALLVAFALAWILAVILVVPVEEGRALVARLVQTAFTPPLEDQPPPNVVALFFEFLFSTVFHPAVLRRMLALYAPYWLMHRLAAIYLADIFGLGSERLHVAERFVEQAAFGRRYDSIQIKEGRVVEEDSILVQIGGPGIVKVELDSAALFERPDGTPLVIGPTNSEIIDEFVRLRRIVDLRDTNDAADLPPTRSKDGVLIGVKDIRFSYSIYRGEKPDRSQTPYPFDKKAVESLVYKDSRSVQPGKPPSMEPEWKAGPFNMKGAILGEMSAFIGSRGLGEFLASIGEPEEKSLQAVEMQIQQRSLVLSGSNGSGLPEPPLRAGPFTPRNMLTEQFHQEGFSKRMAERGFQLNWIGVGTWYTPIEVILSNHREAWRISRENYARGNPQALKALKDEARQQELLRLIRTLPLGVFFKNADVDDLKLTDILLEEYEETLQRAAELSLRGPLALDTRFGALLRQASALLERDPRSYFAPSDYDAFLRDAAARAGSWRVTDSGIEDFLRRAQPILERFGEQLLPADQDFLRDSLRLAADLAGYNRIMAVARALRQIRTPHHPLGAMG